jgi:hypothetical protein
MRLALISRPGTRGNSCAAVMMHNFSAIVSACAVVTHKRVASVIGILNIAVSSHSKPRLAARPKRAAKPALKEFRDFYPFSFTSESPNIIISW